LPQTGVGFVGWVPIRVLIMLVLAAIFTWLMSNTAFGWHVYSIGGNEEAARLSGVPVDRLKATSYVVVGLMAAALLPLVSSSTCV
jgi:erythritol transport system permease protein